LLRLGSKTWIARRHTEQRVSSLHSTRPAAPVALPSLPIPCSPCRWRVHLRTFASRHSAENAEGYWSFNEESDIQPTRPPSPAPNLSWTCEQARPCS
jgi:hypothetical protein